MDNKDFSLYKHASTAQIAELKKSEEEMEKAKEERLMKISNVFDELEQNENKVKEMRDEIVSKNFRLTGALINEQNLSNNIKAK